MITALKQMLPKIETWPADDQQALVDAARGIEAERSGVYDASPDELAAIDRGLEDVRQGRFANDEAVSATRAKIRGE
jgi:predicted transcriptional regulator